MCDLTLSESLPASAIGRVTKAAQNRSFHDQTMLGPSCGTSASGKAQQSPTPSDNCPIKRSQWRTGTTQRRARAAASMTLSGDMLCSCLSAPSTARWVAQSAKSRQGGTRYPIPPQKPHAGQRAEDWQNAASVQRSAAAETPKAHLAALYRPCCPKSGRCNRADRSGSRVIRGWHGDMTRAWA